MKLPIPSFFGKKEIKEYYLALLLQDEQIQAVVFEESGGIIKLVNAATESLPADIDALPFDKLLFSLDHGISTAESTLPQGIQTHKTIFGVKQVWIENGQIAKSHLAVLKKACVELDLSPIGFLIFPEAIAHILQREEGAPVSAILLELGKTSMNATLLRAGRIIESRQGPIEENITASVDRLLSFFADVEILPSRIIISDDANRTHLTQQLISHQWSKSLPFLHMPQVNPLPPEFAVRAILFGIATQMGFTMSDAVPIVPKQTNPFADEAPLPQINTPEEPIEAPVEVEKKEYKPIEEESANDFGFVQDKDVAQEAINMPGQEENSMHDQSFDESEEVMRNETFALIPEEVKEEEEGFGLPPIAQGAAISEGALNVFARFKKVLAAKQSFSPSPYMRKLRRISTKLKGLEGPKALFAIPVLLILVLAGIMLYIFTLHAQVALVMNPKTVSAGAVVTFSTSQSTDLSQNIIAGSAVSVNENGTVTENATGSKNTGNPAKGTVTIYNNTSNSVTLNAGDTIASSNGLNFTLNDDVTVASASGDVFSGTKPGTSDVDVTAQTFGTNYNLPSGTTFTTSQDSVAGKNANAFSGGTQTTLTVVSSSDIAKAEQDLIQNLQDKAKQDLASQNGNGKEILPVFTLESLSQKNPSKNVGDQTSSFTYSATVTYESIAYSSSDIQSLGQTLLKNQMANTLQIHGQIQNTLQNVSPSKDNTSATATMQTSAKLIPAINTSLAAHTLAGKPISQAQSALSNIPQLQSVSVVLTPHIFSFLPFFPHLSSHITVSVTTNE